MRNVLISVLIVLIGWDCLTTYYGTLSIFSQSGTGVIDRILSTDFFIHLTAVIFAVGLIVFILAHKIIMSAKNKLTKGVLGVAFLYDFGTSFYGTAQAVGMGEGRINFAQIAIVLLLSILCTASPILIGQIYEDSAE